MVQFNRQRRMIGPTLSDQLLLPASSAEPETGFRSRISQTVSAISAVGRVSETESGNSRRDSETPAIDQSGTPSRDSRRDSKSATSLRIFVHPVKRSPEPPENRQNLRPSPTGSSGSCDKTRLPADGQLPLRSTAPSPPSDTGWTSCVPPGRSNAWAPKREATGGCSRPPSPNQLDYDA